MILEIDILILLIIIYSTKLQCLLFIHFANKKLKFYNNFQSIIEYKITIISYIVVDNFFYIIYKTIFKYLSYIKLKKQDMQTHYKDILL